MPTILTIICAVVGSSALFSFIQFLISRKDNKDNKLDKVIAKIDAVDTKVDDGFIAVNNKVESMYSGVTDNVESLRASVEENKATTARVRILRASDEILHRMKHSKEWFDQLNDDITFYETYCANHPDFLNNKAKHAIDNINAVYAKALKDGDFL